MADLVTAIGAAGSATTVTSASTNPDPSGANRYVFGIAAGFVADPTAFKYDGPTGTDLDQVGADVTVAGVFTVNLWEKAPGPNADTTISGSFSAASGNSLTGAFFEDVNQTTPGEAVQTNTGDNGGFASSVVATITVTGVESGQEVPVGLFVGVQGGPTISSVVAGADTELAYPASVATSGETQLATTVLRGKATGSTLTLSATITVSASFGTITWWVGARPLNGEGGVTVVFNPLTGRGGAAAQPLAA